MALAWRRNHLTKNCIIFATNNFNNQNLTHKAINPDADLIQTDASGQQFNVPDSIQKFDDLI
jgi:hypothetical protein